jgi:hypothetical protein
VSPAGLPKVPREPKLPLRRGSQHIVESDEPLWRIAATSGPFALRWNAFRTFGPLPQMRWDPHRPPPSEQPGRGVMYAAPHITTVVAERFQKYRLVDPHTGAPFLLGWRPTRPLRCLDLTGDWPVANRAAHALLSGPRSTCRRYAAAILDSWPDLDGLRVRSSIDGRLTFVLFEPAADALPDLPAYARPLTQPDTFAVVHAAAKQLGYAALPPTSTEPPKDVM